MRLFEKTNVEVKFLITLENTHQIFDKVTHIERSYYVNCDR